MKWYDTDFWKWICILCIGSFLLVCFSGCKSKQYVTVPEYHTEYITRTDTFSKVDSIYMKDSVYVYQNGDTVAIHKIAYRDRWHNIYKVKVDTIIKRDSIPYPVVRELTKNEQRLMTLGRIFIVAFVVAAVFWFAFLFYHNKTC